MLLQHNDQMQIINLSENSDAPRTESEAHFVQKLASSAVPLHIIMNPDQLSDQVSMAFLKIAIQTAQKAGRRIIISSSTHRAPNSSFI